MAPKFDEGSPKDADLARPQGDTPVRDRVQELAWAVMDETATPDDLSLLDSLLLSDDEAVADYVGCVQLHVDLLAHFAADSAVGSEGSKRALSFLMDGTPPLGTEPQQT